MVNLPSLTLPSRKLGLSCQLTAIIDLKKFASGATRTHDQSVKSRVLYRLSYGRRQKQTRFSILTTLPPGVKEASCKGRLRTRRVLYSFGAPASEQIFQSEEIVNLLSLASPGGGLRDLT